MFEFDSFEEICEKCPLGSTIDSWEITIVKKCADDADYEELCKTYDKVEKIEGTGRAKCSIINRIVCSAYLYDGKYWKPMRTYGFEGEKIWREVENS